jgi:hypothetical protein
MQSHARGAAVGFSPKSAVTYHVNLCSSLPPSRAHKSQSPPVLYPLLACHPPTAPIRLQALDDASHDGTRSTLARVPSPITLVYVRHETSAEIAAQPLSPCISIAFFCLRSSSIFPLPARLSARSMLGSKALRHLILH